MTRWLVVGHGSVGSALVRRIVRTGARPAVFDPSPRITVTGADHVLELAGTAGTFDCVISCVVPSEARKALDDVGPALGETTLYLDWNTLTPEAKRAIADAAPCPVVDVALMDTLDDESGEPSLAVAGPEAATAAPVLKSLGFHVEIVGKECGDAALLKVARSLFMKSLEALVVEFEAAISPLPGRDVVVASIEKNLGPRFTSFARMLLATDRIHSGRRAKELEEAVAAYRRAGHSTRIPAAAIEVLHAATALWRRPDAPPPGADTGDLAAFLSQRLAGDGEGRAGG